MRITRVKHAEEGDLCKIYSYADNRQLYACPIEPEEVLVRTGLEGRWKSMADEEKQFCFLRANGTFYWLPGNVRVEIIDGVQDPGT